MDERLETQIGPLLRQNGWTLAVAESCTGGLIGDRITNIPGSSEYYLGSVTAYAYEAKQRLLGVQPGTLLQYGAVSAETAVEMARGIRQALNADIGLSVTGIAGPGGGMPDKPVGLVWIGLSAPGGEWTFRRLWQGSRVQNKACSAQAALQHLVDYLVGKTGSAVDVTVHCTPGVQPDNEPEPLRFTWQGHSYQMESTGRRWHDEQGFHILCMTGTTQVFELIFDQHSGKWQMGYHPPSQMTA